MEDMGVYAQRVMDKARHYERGDMSKEISYFLLDIRCSKESMVIQFITMSSWLEITMYDVLKVT